MRRYRRGWIWTTCTWMDWSGKGCLACGRARWRHR